jgi:hypothetical protein
MTPMQKAVPRPREPAAPVTTEQERLLHLASGLSASRLWLATPGGVINSDKVVEALQVGVWQGDITLLEKEQVRPQDGNVASTLSRKPEFTAGHTDSEGGGEGCAR